MTVTFVFHTRPVSRSQRFPWIRPFSQPPLVRGWGHLSPTGTSQVSPTLLPPASVSPSNGSHDRAHTVGGSVEGIFLTDSSHHPAPSSPWTPSARRASKKCHRSHRCHCGCGPQPFDLSCSCSELPANLRPLNIKLNVPSHQKHASAPHALGSPIPPAPPGPTVLRYQREEVAKFQDFICNSLQMKCQKYWKDRVINLTLI